MGCPCQTQGGHLRQFRAAALKYLIYHLLHANLSIRRIPSIFFFFFFKHYSQFQRDPKEEIATRWDILKKKKPALYVEALKYIIQAEKMALILHE